MRTRLQRYISRSPGDFVFEFCFDRSHRIELCMGTTIVFVPANPNHLVVGHDNATHHRVRFYVALSVLRRLDGKGHIVLIGFRHNGLPASDRRTFKRNRDAVENDFAASDLAGAQIDRLRYFFPTFVNDRMKTAFAKHVNQHL